MSTFFEIHHLYISPDFILEGTCGSSLILICHLTRKIHGIICTPPAGAERADHLISSWVMMAMSQDDLIMFEMCSLTLKLLRTNDLKSIGGRCCRLPLDSKACLISIPCRASTETTRALQKLPLSEDDNTK